MFIFPVLFPIFQFCKNEHPWLWLSDYSHFHLDNGVAMNDFRFAASLIPQLSEFSACPIGEVVMHLLALPAVDYAHGRDESRKFFDYAKFRFEQIEEISDSELPWHVQDIQRHIGLLELLFFGEFQSRDFSASHDCFGLKFFFYQVPETEARTPIDENDENFLNFFGHEAAPMSCAFGMYGTEIAIPSLLWRKFPHCVTSDAAVADFFIAPSYFKCLDQLNWVDNFAEEGKVATRLLDETVRFLERKETWKKHRGLDHVFIFSWGLFPCKLSGFNDGRLLDAVNLQVENICTRENEEAKLASYSSWKDVLIPGLVDKWRILELKKHAKSPAERDILFTFHGRTYGPNTTREFFVNQLKELPNTSIGGFIENYHETIGRSWFCLVARGVTSWTIHLFVALFGGCVPVIVSDDLVFPFDQGLVDFDAFVVRWPERLPPFDLFAYLSNMPSGEYLRRQGLAAQAACWFDYFSEDLQCSAMIGIFRGLKKKRIMREILVQ